jgi:hypothetical protein
MSAALSKTTTRLYFTDEANRIGSGWREVVITKSADKVRIVDPRTGAAHSYSPKRWAELDLERSTAKLLAKSNGMGQKIAENEAKKADEAAKSPAAKKREAAKLAAAQDAAIVEAMKAEKPAPTAKPDKGELVELTKNAIDAGKPVTKIAAGVKGKSKPTLAPVPAPKSDAQMKAAAAVTEKVAAAPNVAAMKAAAEKAAAKSKPAAKQTPAAKPAKTAAKSVAKPAKSVAAKPAKKAAAKSSEPRAEKPSALVEAKLLIIANPAITADEIVENIVGRKNGLNITIVTARTVRSDFLNSVRALKRAGFLKDAAFANV